MSHSIPSYTKQNRRNETKEKEAKPQEPQSILEVLMRRDNMAESDALELIQEAREDLYYRISQDDYTAHDICAEYFGLEPDYLSELIPI